MTQWRPMKCVEGQVRLSATDLAGHVACRHLTMLELAVARAGGTRPEATNWLPLTLQRRGEAHERAYVDFLRSQALRIVDLRDCRFDRDGFRATQTAMTSGADVILQPPLGDDRWIGRADVLERVECPSKLGSWS